MVVGRAVKKVVSVPFRVITSPIRAGYKIMKTVATIYVLTTVAKFIVAAYLRSTVKSTQISSSPRRVRRVPLRKSRQSRIK